MNRAPGNTVFRSQFVLQLRAGTDFQNLGFCQFRAPVPLPPAIRPMNQPVRLVFCWRLPFQMFAVAAAFMALAAGVRRFVFRGRRRAMLALANNAADAAHFAVVLNQPIPLAARRIRPRQALVPIEGEDSVFQKSKWPAFAGAAAKRGAMVAPPLVMCVAPASPIMSLAAAFDRANPPTHADVSSPTPFVIVRRGDCRPAELSASWLTLALMRRCPAGPESHEGL